MTKGIAPMPGLPQLWAYRDSTTIIIPGFLNLSIGGCCGADGDPRNYGLILMFFVSRRNTGAHVLTTDQVPYLGVDGRRW